MSVTSAKDPVYVDDTKTAVDLTVTIDGYPGEHPYTAVSGDPLFDRALAGEFGDIADAPVPPPPTAEQLIAYANAKQWILATSGYTVTIDSEPVLFQTTETAMALIAGKAQQFARPNPPVSVDWQIGPTEFVTIAAADFVSAATKIADFVQATFDELKAVLAEIVAGTITMYSQIDAAAWPAAHD